MEALPIEYIYLHGAKILQILQILQFYRYKVRQLRTIRNSSPQQKQNA